MTTKNSSSTYLLLLMTILLWGINWPLSKIGLNYMSALWHAAIRILLGSLTLFVLLAVMGRLKLPTKADLPIVITTGLIQISFFIILINLGLLYVDAGRSAILVYTIPLWVTPFAVLFFNEKLNFMKCLGLGLGIIGVLILFSPWSIDWSSNETIMGNAYLLLAAICMAVAICSSRNMKWQSSPFEMSPWLLLVGAIPTLLIAYINEPVPEIAWNNASIWSMAYTGVLATALGNMGVTVVSHRLPSITVSLGLLGVPLAGVISAYFILGEDITPTMIAAMLFIFSGLGFVALSGRMNKRILPFSIFQKGFFKNK